MCFRWLKRLYHCLRRKCSRRSRGYSREISLSHGGFCSGAFSDGHGRASFSCGRESSVTFSRGPSHPPPPRSIPAGYPWDTGGDCGLTSGWDLTAGTVPVYGPGLGYGGGDAAPCHGAGLGMAEGAGAGWGYGAPLGDTLTAGGLSEGSGYGGGGLAYGAGTFPGPELGGCAQLVQQKCPVVVPAIPTQQCKQESHWPPVQKK